jgi:magnesium chelatase family protein
MLAKALSCAVVGLDSALVEVEVDLSPGLPSFQKYGMKRRISARCLSH